MEIQVIKHRGIFLGIAAILVATSVVGLAVFGLRTGIDFEGGTLWQINFSAEGGSASGGNNPPTQEMLRSFVQSNLAPEAIVTQSDEGAEFNLRLKELSEAEHQQYADALEGEFGNFEELSFQSIGASVGAELVRRAIWAVLINLLAIVLYVAYAFRKVSIPVNSWKYSAITLATLFHDAIIPVGLFAFLGYFMGVEIDTNFIVATLVVMGFSVHDTIVVFDRIRENLHLKSSRESFDDLVNRSVNETMARSINTSLTLIVVLVALLVLGASTLNYFILVILLGTILGTYSSIFVASPLLTLWNKKRGQ
ncbi:MAG: protein translocase subunit SecF [bacterium]|nr:protein translocase subunit SecF [bacterium]